MAKKWEKTKQTNSLPSPLALQLGWLMPNKRVWVWIGLDLISKLREFKVPRSNMIKLPSHLLPAIRPARSETLGGSPRGQWFWSASWDAFASWTIGKAPRQPPQKNGILYVPSIYNYIQTTAISWQNQDIKTQLFLVGKASWWQLASLQLTC